MNAVITVGAFVVALAVLIVVHEYGHYRVAKFCGVKVLRFSIGFGRPLWLHRARDGTEWAICAIPVGGYVKMLDEHDGPVARADLHRAFDRQSVWRRIAIVTAGPLANFLLAIVLYWLLFMHGVHVAKPMIDTPDPGSIAAASGLHRGDTIVKVNGQAVASWQDARWNIVQLAMERAKARLEVRERSGEIALLTLNLGRFQVNGSDGDPLARIGLHLFRPDIDPVIGTVTSGGVAQRAGIRAGDRIIAIDGRPIKSWKEVVDTVRAHAGTHLVLDLRRDGRTVRIALTPAVIEHDGKRFGRIGASVRVDPRFLQSFVTTVRYNPYAALTQSLTRTWDTASFSLRMLGKMLVGEVSWRNLSGPVTIADYAGQSAELGLGPYMAFLALISISLGVLNLLPIPLLDGGHLMYYAVEIMKGSPVSERAMELGQRFGLTLLLLLMGFAFYNDINRLLSG